MKKTYPEFIYGTAWKKDQTTDLVTLALRMGFKAIDTANQAKHYQEPLVGQALKSKFAEGLERSSLFLQTKFTSIDGQDHRLPYDPKASLTKQVQQSFESSLEHLGTDYLDSYLLHGPYNYPGLGDEDWEVWSAIENLKTSGRTKSIGISNVNALQLQELCAHAKIKPMTVQNRCFANRGWDADVRETCSAQGIVYQGFSLLTANPQIVQHAHVLEIADRHEKSPQQIVFRFTKQLGIVPLTGTTSETHMREDLLTNAFTLEESEMKTLSQLT